MYNWNVILTLEMSELPHFVFYVRIWANKKLNTVLYGSQHNNRFRICNTELRLI